MVLSWGERNIESAEKRIPAATGRRCRFLKKRKERKEREKREKREVFMKMYPGGSPFLLSTLLSYNRIMKKQWG